MTQNSDGKPIGAGKSSFGLIDTARFFQELDLNKGITFLDAACGRGAYTLATADVIGPEGRLVAVDLWEDGISILQKEAAAKQIENLTTFVGDVSLKIPMENNSADVCLMATVLHDLAAEGVDQEALKEVARVVKPGGTLVIVEFHKKEGPPGPPKPVRLSPEEVDKMVSALGFRQKRYTEIGPDNYLQIFTKTE
jgi:ubiquinone/menaquinone biosynthesis C-methylase UbiE